MKIRYTKYNKIVMHAVLILLVIQRANGFHYFNREPTQRFFCCNFSLVDVASLVFSIASTPVCQSYYQHPKLNSMSDDDESSKHVDSEMS
jgi:hypothetical protein